MLKVKNALGKEFHSCCKMLCQEIVRGKYVPDLVIGVLTGGGYVGGLVYEELRSLNQDMVYKEVRLQRGGTQVKSKSHIEKVLKVLPYSLLNLLRILEVEYLEMKAKFIKPSRYGTIEWDFETDTLLKQGSLNILLVDDCIDTGMTLKIIKERLIQEYGDSNNIKIAVITTAHRHPVLAADFSLYNRVLIRFPWANDAK